MTLPSRKLAAMFACVFLLGAIAGALAAMNLIDLRFSNFLARTSDPAALAQRIDHRLVTRYNLDAGEQARINPLTLEMTTHLHDLREKFGADVMATLDASHDKIGAQMTPEQRAAYLKDNLARRQRAASMLLPSPSGDGNHS